MSDKTYTDVANMVESTADRADTPATADTATDKVDTTESTATAESTLATLQSTANADPLATLQAKLQSLQAKLHKEFRWYCDTILQGGSLAVRIAYRVHCAVETIEMVDNGEVRDDPALGEPMCYIGTSLYSEEDLDKLLAVEYLLDDLYDAWCGLNHTDEEWSDTVDRYLDTIEGRYPNNK